MTGIGRQGRLDVLALGLMLALLLGWDALGLDLQVVRWFGTVQGFALRDSWWAGSVLHQGGRWVAALLLLGLALAAWRAPRWVQGKPSRRQRLAWFGVTLLCLVAVPTLKRFSASSCPWDLHEFGGVASYVSHWQWGLADGGPGHCFPSGHAVAAFAFLGMYFMWRQHSPARGRTWLAGVLLAGALFGLAQAVRGAHYPSHTLWSAWVCWAICVAAAAIERIALRPACQSSSGLESRWSPM